MRRSTSRGRGLTRGDLEVHLRMIETAIADAPPGVDPLELLRRTLLAIIAVFERELAYERLRALVDPTVAASLPRMERALAYFRQEVEDAELLARLVELGASPDVIREHAEGLSTMLLALAHPADA